MGGLTWPKLAFLMGSLNLAAMLFLIASLNFWTLVFTAGDAFETFGSRPKPMLDNGSTQKKKPWRHPKDGEWACYLDDCEHYHKQQWLCHADQVIPDRLNGPQFTEAESDSIKKAYAATHIRNPPNCMTFPE